MLAFPPPPVTVPPPETAIARLAVTGGTNAATVGVVWSATTGVVALVVVAAVELGAAPKVSVTVAAEPTVQVDPVPEQPPPLHPVSTLPEAGVAVSVTDVPFVNGAEHVEPQLIPAGELVMLPPPLATAFSV